MLIHHVPDFYNGPVLAIAEAVVAFQCHMGFQSMIINILLDHLKGLFITPAETGTPHAYLQFFFYQHVTIGNKYSKGNN